MGYKQVSKIATTAGILTLTQYPVTIANDEAYVANMAQGTMESFVISCRNYTNKILSTPDNTRATLLQFKNGNKIEFRRESWGSNNWGPLYIQFTYANGTYYWATTYQNFDPLNVYGSGGCKNILILILENEANPTDVRVSVLGLFGNAPYSDHAQALSNMYNFLNGSFVSEDPYETAPGSRSGGGYGDFDYTSDDIDFSPLPTLSVVDSGFVTLYKPTIGQLKSLAQYMWSGLFDINTFRKIFADPMDCIISLAMIPLTPPASTSQELKVGNVSTGITIDRLSSQFVEVNFAMKNIGLRSNGFMDFSPYTKAQIFLPYIGIRSLSIDDIAGKDLTLKYKIDLFTGSCNASIKCGNSVLYQFTGNVIANIPITAQNFSGMLQAAIGAVGAAVGVATGAGALAGVASAVNAATSMKPDIEKSGNLSATSGFLGQQLPYLILTYPNLCRPDGRDKTVGTPSFIGLSASRPLSAFHGITKLHKINVKSIPCTDAERDEIEALLMEGVIMP